MIYFWLPDRVDTTRVTRNIALQTKNKFEGLGDIILRVMGQLAVPFSAEETFPRPRHRQADITSPSMFGSVLPSKLVYAAGVVSLTIVLDNAVHRVVHVVLCQLRSTFT